MRDCSWPEGPASGYPESSLASRRHRLHTARDWLLSGGSVLFFGPAGVGKSAAVDVITAPVVHSRCLRHHATEADACRRYATLAGLFATVSDAELEETPSARRRILADAIAGSEDAPVAAVRLAALNLLRVLARARSLLLIVDDLQWVDPASAEVLQFVAPRVEDLRVQIAAAEQVQPDGLPRRRALCPPPLLVVRLDQITSPTGTDPDADVENDVDGGHVARQRRPESLRGDSGDRPDEERTDD